MMMLREILRSSDGRDIQRDVCGVRDRVDAVIRATADVRNRVPAGRARGLYVVMEIYGPQSYHQRQIGNTIHIAVS
jgi:hypothetical protein